MFKRHGPETYFPLIIIGMNKREREANPLAVDSKTLTQI